MQMPFDARRLDTLMDQAGLDALFVTSKHNVQYLTGGHRALFFSFMDAIGISRYLPVLLYVKDRPDLAAYYGARLETAQVQNHPLWLPQVQTKFSTGTDGVKAAAEYLVKLGYGSRRIGVERSFLPLEAAEALQQACPGAQLAEALFVLERLRAVKRPDELEKLRLGSELIIDSMLAVIGSAKPGMTKQQLNDALKAEEARRGLDFEYCLIAAGASHNRAPSGQKWNKGDVLSLDSGGNYQGYIGDLARMAIIGAPDTEQKELLEQVESVQQAVIRRVEPGVRGGDLFEFAHAALAETRVAEHTEFVAHGMGMISHEAPRLTSTGPVPYPADDADRGLESGMVLSIETTLQHPRRGFIKLEDTVAVTPDGHEVYGDRARGWNQCGV